jgi:post-segregation antitoxin (ccd killing protein)
MGAPYNVSARKRPVNLTLNEDLVAQARCVTDHLSGVIESLLADFLTKQKQQHVDEVRALKETSATWNTFAEKHGAFADEYSTL